MLLEHVIGLMNLVYYNVHVVMYLCILIDWIIYTIYLNTVEPLERAFWPKDIRIQLNILLSIVFKLTSHWGMVLKFIDVQYTVPKDKASLKIHQRQYDWDHKAQYTWGNIQATMLLTTMLQATFDEHYKRAYMQRKVASNI